MTHVVHGRPKGQPDFEPLRLAIDPGDASPEEIAEFLVSISNLSTAFGAGPVVWTMACPCCRPESG